MGIVPATGSKMLEDDQKTPEQLTSTDTTTSFDERLLKRDYVSSTFNTRTGLNVSRMKPIIETLGKLASGSPIKVIYFSQIVNFTNKKSTTTDYSAILNNVNKAYSKILNMEIRLNEALTFNYDPDDNESEVEGVGKILPDFPVNAGDVFLYEVSPNNFGIFVISNSVPLSLHRGSFQEVSFFLKEWATPELIEKFEACVYDTFYYSTQNVLGETRVLLKKEDYFNLLSIIKLRKDIITYYEDTFYDRDRGTLFRKDQLYDPYIVQFMNQLISFDESRFYPYKQLLPSQIWDKDSILTELMEDKRTRFGFTSIKKYITLQYMKGALSSALNDMVARWYLELDAEGEKNYLELSNDFLNKNPLTDPFELILQEYISTKVVNVSSMMTYCDSVGAVDLLKQFYQLPILVFLCNKVIMSIGG